MESSVKKLKSLYSEVYQESEKIVSGDSPFDTSSSHVKVAIDLAKIKHAFRGAALTLLSYKLIKPSQDIRAHKAEYENGFSARGVDSQVTIPFLMINSLPRSVETHWLTQTLSFAPTLLPDVTLKTTPKKAGPLLIEVVNYAEQLDEADVKDMVTAIMCELIRIRNKDRVTLTKPKGIPIDSVKGLLYEHFRCKYKSNAPRLPQIAIYAIYQSIIGQMARFEGQELEVLQRMKSADRKSGTVGDIVIQNADGEPVEAVEVKFEQPISEIHVREAMDKVRGASVSRYYLLSTAGVEHDSLEEIIKLKDSFLKKNGCEIIVNGVIETVGYYLRLLPNTTVFLANYATIVEVDEDTSYEHRIAWNKVCDSL